MLDAVRAGLAERLPSAAQGDCVLAQDRSNTVAVIHRRKSSLSKNCLNSSASSFTRPVTMRSSTLSCSMRALASSEFRRAFRKAASAATLEGMVVVISFPTRSRSSQATSLRHSYASFALGQGETVPTIGRLLGHVRPETTLRYIHFADDRARAAAETVGAALEAG